MIARTNGEIRRSLSPKESDESTKRTHTTKHGTDATAAAPVSIEQDDDELLFELQTGSCDEGRGRSGQVKAIVRVSHWSDGRRDDAELDGVLDRRAVLVVAILGELEPVSNFLDDQARRLLERRWSQQGAKSHSGHSRDLRDKACVRPVLLANEWHGGFYFTARSRDAITDADREYYPLEIIGRNVSKDRPAPCRACGLPRSMKNSDEATR